MCYQECALYGELVLWLRDRAAELLAAEPDGVEAQRERLDALIHDWFFTAQDELHGCAPRDLIWAEQLEQPNPIHPEHLDDFFDDDCLVCQAEKERLKAALDAGEEHGWQWHHDDGGMPLIACYDPEGWEARWAGEAAHFEAPRTQEGEEHASPFAPDYEPPPAEPRKLDEQAFLEFLRRPWVDPALHQAAQKLVEHCDVPVPDAFTGLHYRRVTQSEAVSLAVGLAQQGVNVEALLAQIDAFPYQNVALDWLSQPEQNAAMMIQAMEQTISPGDEAELARFRHHRDFIFALAQVIHPGARLWLQGWLDAVSGGAFTRNSGGEGADDVF